MGEGESRHRTEERPRAPLAELVGERVAAVQAQFLTGTSAGVSQLAALRRAATSPVGSDPQTWELTVAGVSPWARGDDATDDERAVHAALTLYALHQQSRSQPMHRRGPGLGAAIRALGEATQARSAVRRRFEALGTAATFPELLHHARGLVGQLRSAGIALDYARLALDLRDWQDAARSASVRLRWGRDYHRVPHPDTRPDSTQETA
jgi:CRISPR system Cascade subunit CasB